MPIRRPRPYASVPPSDSLIACHAARLTAHHSVASQPDATQCVMNVCRVKVHAPVIAELADSTSKPVRASRR